MSDLVEGDQESPNVSAALALPRALERGVHGEALRDLYTDDVVSVEHPNAIAPRGSQADLDHIVAASRAGAALLSSQRYAIRDVHEDGNLVMFRYTWTGVVGTDRGPFRAGQELTAHVAAFATISAGRISHFETFDCYEPFEVPYRKGSVRGPAQALVVRAEAYGSHEREPGCAQSRPEK